MPRVASLTERVWRQAPRDSANNGLLLDASDSPVKINMKITVGNRRDTIRVRIVALLASQFAKQRGVMRIGIYPPRRSGEGSPIGAFRDVERSEGLYDPIVGVNHGRRMQRVGCNVAEDGNDAARMARTAIVINAA